VQTSQVTGGLEAARAHPLRALDDGQAPPPHPGPGSEPAGVPGGSRPRSLRLAHRPGWGGGTQLACGHSSRCSSRQGQAPAGWASLGLPPFTPYGSPPARGASWRRKREVSPGTCANSWVSAHEGCCPGIWPGKAKVQRLDDVTFSPDNEGQAPGPPASEESVRKFHPGEPHSDGLSHDCTPPRRHPRANGYPFANLVANHSSAVPLLDRLSPEQPNKPYLTGWF
jgi:hypothetical protein